MRDWNRAQFTARGALTQNARRDLEELDQLFVGIRRLVVIEDGSLNDRSQTQRTPSRRSGE